MIPNKWSKYLSLGENSFILMKHLFLLFAFLPFILTAQDNSKYLEGAVPVENGRVVFSQEINAPSLSQNEVYETALNWAEERFNKEDCRVVYQNRDEGEIAATGKEYIIFSSTALSLDRSKMSYQVLIYCQEQLCTIKLTNIRYEYDVAYQREPEKYLAEEWITDENAIHKGKLNRISGKFRRKTIDFADELFSNAKNAFGQQALQTQATSPTPVAEAEATQVKENAPANQPAAIQNTPAGFTRMDVSNIPNTLKQLLPDSDMRIKMADNNLNESQAEWKGISTLFGKEIASFSADANSAFCKGVKEGEIYTIQFSKKPFAQEAVWMILECKMQGLTPDGDKQTVIGEIINVWVK